jgi:hypothetical protein
VNGIDVVVIFGRGAYEIFKNELLHDICSLDVGFILQDIIDLALYLLILLLLSLPSQVDAKILL